MDAEHNTDERETPRLGRSGWFLISLASLYLLLAIGPLLALPLYAPQMLLSPSALRDVGGPLLLSLRSSAVATLASVLLGLPAAVCLARLQFRGKHVLNALVELPIALPPLVLGVALILMWGRRGILGHYLADAGHPLSFTPSAIVIAQFVVASPFFVRIAKTAIEQVPPSLEHASRVLGASPLRTYARVTLPLAGRGLISAVVTCWARAMSEFGATILFAGNFPGRTQTLPVSIFMAMQFDIDRAVTMAVITMVFSIAAFLLAQLGLRTAAP